MSISPKRFLLVFFISVYSFLQAQDPFGAWEFRQVGTDTWYPAQVPGTVHTDLLANGLIPDPFIGTNEKIVQWVETEDWEYRSFFIPLDSILKHENIDMIFHGLDTFADVYINGNLILKTDNMNRTWKSDITSLLQNSNNEIRILFHSAVKVGQERLEELPYFIPATNEYKPIGKQNSIFSRKAPYHFGWDWGPRLVGCGIWRPIELKGWSKGKINNVKFSTHHANEDSATLSIKVDFISSSMSLPDIDINFEGVNQKILSIEHTENIFRINVRIYEPDLWWPAGSGEQFLYPVIIKLFDEGSLIDNYKINYGIRTIELKTEPDSLGESFLFEINGRPVFAKGANYIPSDFFNTRSPSTYERVINDALAANMNMLRIWGGSIYENEEFYALCDAKGILIWQDFMFACAMVPTQEDILQNIKLEAVDAVKRLNNHPCIALWCGNNENLSAWFEWGWQELYDLHGQDSLKVWKTYDILFNQTLPQVVSEYGEGNYWASSPSSGVNKLQNSVSGDQHEWGVWFGQLSFDHYEENAGRFISEYGLQALPEMNTIRKFDPSVSYWTLESEALNFRQRSQMPWIAEDYDGFDMMKHYIDMYFPSPENLEEFIYLSQLTQAQALQTAAETHRRNKPYTMGSMFWQIDDVWPTVSWSTVDYFGNWKAAHYAIREAYKPVIISVDKYGELLNVHVLSDLIESFQSKLELSLRRMDGTILNIWDAVVSVPENGNTVVFTKSINKILDGQKAKAVFLKMKLTQDDKIIDEGIYYFVGPKELELIKPEITKSINEFKVTLKTDQLAKGIYLSTGNIKGHFSDNYFDLLPGDEKTVTFTPKSYTDNFESSLTVTSLADIIE